MKDKHRAEIESIIARLDQLGFAYTLAVKPDLGFSEAYFKWYGDVLLLLGMSLELHREIRQWVDTSRREFRGEE